MTSTNRAKLEALLELVNSATHEAITEYEKAGGDVPSIDSTEPHPLDDVANNLPLKSALRTLEGACAQLCTTLAPPSRAIINLVNVHDHACIRIALNENITDILMDHPKGIHIDELSKLVKMDAKKLVRVMRLLATRGCYNEVEVDTFSNNRLSLMLHTDNPVRHLVDLVVVVHKGGSVLYENLKDPKTAYSESTEHAPFIYAHNSGVAGTVSLFDLMKTEETRREHFNHAMRALNSLMGSLAFLTQFPFEKYSTVVDVGGGVGGFSLSLAKAHRHIKITLQDLPETLIQARDFWARDYAEAVQENRIEFSDLDFFTQIPAKGKDIYYLRGILHDWSDDKAELILRNVRKAIGSNSRVLIHGYVVSGLNRKQAELEAASTGTVVASEPLLPNFGVGNMDMYQWDLSMWLVHNSRERTLQDTLKLTTAAGLKLEKAWDLVETCVLEFSAA